MAWIESHQALGHHPKTLALAEQLHCSLPAAVGHLQYLWWWALDYAQDGLVTARTRPIAIRACQVQRQPDRFWTALVDAGFVDVLDQEKSVWRIHDWQEYAGRLIDRRRNDAERKRTARAELQTTSTGNPADGHRMSGARPVVPTNQPTGPTGPVGGEGKVRTSRARGDDGFQPLGSFLPRPPRRRAPTPTPPTNFSDLPDEVQARLSQPPIGSDAHG